MNNQTNRTTITESIDQVTVRIPSARAHEALLHREVNQHLLDHGHGAITYTDLAHEMEAMGYQRFLDACGRAHWRGIGVLSDRTEEAVVGVDEMSPVRTRSSHAHNLSIEMQYLNN